MESKIIRGSSNNTVLFIYDIKSTGVFCAIFCSRYNLLLQALL